MFAVMTVGKVSASATARNAHEARNLAMIACQGVIALVSSSSSVPERRSGTLELLLTMPITPWQAIIAKFLASWAFLAVALALTFPTVITANILGDPDNGQILAGYLRSLLLAGAYLAIACMTSAMTRNQVVAFILSVVLCLFLILAGFNPVTDLLTRWASPALVDTVAAFSVVTHFDGFQRGVIDLRDLVFFLSVIGFALFATGIIIRGHRAG